MKKDLIGREDIINKITSFVNGLDKKEHLTISIDGDWGSGKTFVVDELYEKLNGDKNNIVVLFDAWKNSFYNDPLIALLYEILDVLKNIDKDHTLDRKECLTNATKIITDVLEDIGNLTPFGLIIKPIKDFINNFNKTNNSTLDKNIVFNDFVSYNKILNKTKECIENISKEFKFILLVDEIDRCLPDNQLIVLERIHHLFDINNSITIIALNKKIVKENFNKKYTNSFDYGEEYLRKFFNYSIYLDDSKEVYFRNGLIKVYEETIKDFKLEKHKHEIQIILEMILNIDENKIDKEYDYKNPLNKLSNREFNNYFNTLKKVLIEYQINNNLNINSFYAISILLFYSINYPKIFNVFKDGSIKYGNFVFLDNILDDETVKTFKFNDYSTGVHHTFDDYDYNRVQYLLNSFLMRKNVSNIGYKLLDEYAIILNGIFIKDEFMDEIIEMLYKFN